MIYGTGRLVRPLQGSRPDLPIHSNGERVERIKAEVEREMAERVGWPERAILRPDAPVLTPKPGSR